MSDLLWWVLAPFGVTWLIWLVGYSSGDVTNYYRRAFCKCGYQETPNLFYTDDDICPECGTSKHGYKIKVVRWRKKKGWFTTQEMEERP